MTDARYLLTWKIRRLFKLLAETSDTYLEPYGISVQERAVVEHLMNWGPASVPQIARLFYVSRQNIQVRVNGLLEKGWVQKDTNPAHQRSVLLRLAKKGKDNFASIQKQEAALMDSLFEGIRPTDLQQANITLRNLTNSLLTQLNKDTENELE